MTNKNKLYVFILFVYCTYTSLNFPLFKKRIETNMKTSWWMTKIPTQIAHFLLYWIYTFSFANNLRNLCTNLQVPILLNNKHDITTTLTYLTIDFQGTLAMESKSNMKFCIIPGHFATPGIAVNNVKTLYIVYRLEIFFKYVIKPIPG